MQEDIEIVYMVFGVRGALAGFSGRAHPGRTDLDGIIDDIAAGRYSEPTRVVAFNLAEGWASDVSLYVTLACIERKARLNNEWRSPRLVPTRSKNEESAGRLH